MIKLLLLILLGFVLYAFVLTLLRPGTPPHRARRPEISGETMVEDPVCGTFLPQNDALKARIRGQEHYFCSKHCLEEFNRQIHDTNQS